MLSSPNDQRRIEEALRESEARFRSLLDQANDAIFLLLDGVFVDCNAKGQEMYGRTREQILGRMPDDLAPPVQPDGRDSQEKGLEIFQKVLAGEAQFFEWLSCLPDGTPLHTEVSLNRLELSGKIYIQAIVRDVTERLRSERAKSESEMRFKALVEQSPVAIGISRNGFGIYANQRFLDIFRLKGADDYIGRHVSTFFAPEVQEQSRERIRLRSEGLPAPSDFETIGLRWDGSTFPVHVVVAEVTLDAGKAAIGFLTDISERKRAEAKIAEQAALLAEARDAIIVRDMDGKILFWNNGAERIYDYPPEEVLGRNVLEVLHTPRRKFEEINRTTINQGEWKGELRHATKDRRKLVVEIRCTLIRDSEGRPKSILSIATDITERKRIEAQFMRAQRMESVGTLAGGIAHDLNNILAPIMMSIEVLKQRTTDPQSRKILDTIAGNSMRGAAIVRQLLSFARGMEGERIVVEPGDLVKSTETIIKDTFPKNIQLELRVPDQTWNILGDLTQLHQVLLNLCLNARDAMPHGGRLCISVENTSVGKSAVDPLSETNTDRHIVISVADTGTGIPTSVIDKIFEPFFTTKDLGKGTGLGLSMVLAIVKSHGGFVNVASTPEQGTTFKVYLPALDPANDPGRDTAELPALPRGKGETVLIVDDEPSVLLVTSETLKGFSYRALTARDGSEALAVYAQHRDEIAVVLTDMAMPVMDGAATIRGLRQINPAVKIMVASGSTTGGELSNDAELHITHFLAKPYTAATLLKTLRALLDDAAKTP